MSFLALHNLRQHKLRLALSISGVALAMMLILLLNGFLSGIYDQVTAYLDNTPEPRTWPAAYLVWPE